MGAVVSCILCRRELAPMEIQCCLRCVGQVRRQLVDVERLYALLPAMLGRPDAASLGSVLGGRSDETRLPGGDALAMMGPGSPMAYEGGLEGDPADPPAVGFELGTWVEAWSEVRRESVRLSASVPAKVAWLSVRVGWAAAHHGAFAYFASDLRRIVARLEAVTGMSDAPERGVSCPYCGEALERWATDHGYEDDWACPRCRLAFTPGQYNLALRAELENRA